MDLERGPLQKYHSASTQAHAINLSPTLAGASASGVWHVASVRCQVAVSVQAYVRRQCVCECARVQCACASECECACECECAMCMCIETQNEETLIAHGNLQAKQNNEAKQN